MNAIILCSGGLDSVAVAHSIKEDMGNIKILFINYGQRTNKEEEEYARLCAKDIEAEFIKIELPWLKTLCTSKLTNSEDLPKPDVSNVERSKEDILCYWVPARNSLFVTIALSLAESLDLQGKGVFDIYLGIKNEGNVQMKDTTPEFIEVMNKVSKQATHHGRYKVIAPFINMDKVELVKKYDHLVPWEKTYSCYKGGELHCGECENCILRKKAFYWANIKDPTKYVNE